MAFKKNWKIKENSLNPELIKYCSDNIILAQLLQNRGIDTKEKIFNFLNPLKAKFISPDVFTDMSKIVLRIKSAIENKEHITIYGDFDADGVTSTALLYLTLKKIGADVDFYMPDRAMESHGLNTKALVKLISKKKTKLIITVDCGISNVSEVNFAKGFKTDIIITDHHESPEEIPDAFAILNPKVPDNTDSNLPIEDIQSLNYLSGVGVAFKLACKLLQEYCCEDYVNELLILAAIGTVGDVVELIGENRSIVAMGLELIRNGKHKGIQKLLSASGVNDIKSVTAETIAFYIVPRLNAAGRLDSPLSAINLLISDDEEVINSSVKLLNDLNTLRQNLCDEVYNCAKNAYLSDINNNKNSIILFNKEWHLGIIGIVASKLTETFNKPVFLMTEDPNNPNIIRCSCRSIQGINIHSVLSEHKDLFEGFGGHKMAAGFAFDLNKTSFDNFKKLLSSTIEQYSQDIDFLSVSLDADMLINSEDINVDTIKLIEKMQPFGAGNPEPLFVMNKLLLNNYKMMGQNNNHLKMFLTQNSTYTLECVKWNEPDFNLPLNSELDILFSLKLNSFNDNINIQLMIKDFHSEALNKKIEIRVLDHRNKKNILMQVLDFIGSTKKSTAIFLENTLLKKQLNLPENITNKLFSIENIPNEKEQLMFFDCPNSLEEFNKIIKNTDAKIVHLMNFNINKIKEEEFISKFSGMLKYAISHLNGKFNVNQISCALSVDCDTVDCALSLLENVNSIELERASESECKILNIKPIELSKIKQDDLYLTLCEKIKSINDFRQYYLNSSIDEIKSNIAGCC